MDSSMTSYLEGNMLAIQAALRALILGSPEPTVARLKVSAEINKVHAIALNKMLPDELVAAIADAKGRILPTVDEERIAQKSPPN
jgi:hypothetical protein